MDTQLSWWDFFLLHGGDFIVAAAFLAVAVLLSLQYCCAPFPPDSQGCDWVYELAAHGVGANDDADLYCDPMGMAVVVVDDGRERPLEFTTTAPCTGTGINLDIDYSPECMEIVGYVYGTAKTPPHAPWIWVEEGDDNE
jgi:hypothetical protein